MGLSQKIEDALTKGLGIEEPEGGRGNIPIIAKEITDAIIEFLQEQTFTITEMKAPLEVEEIDTAAPLQGDVLPSVTTTVPPGITVATSGGPGATTSPTTAPVTTGTKGVLIPPLLLRKTPNPGEVPQGGILTALGTAYIGRNPIQADGAEDTTKVKLLKIAGGSR
tara:strand:- start:173 stop:670 length:498 start_codon:yes stop_codon:yes gene_type:complete